MYLIKFIKWMPDKVWNSSTRTKIVALALLIFSVHIVYTADIDYGETIADDGKKVKPFHGGVGTLVKLVESDTSKKKFYKQCRARRRERRRSDNTRTLRFGLMIRMLLLCSGIESNPGPTSVECQTCHQTFNRPSRLRKHEASASPSPCEICGVVFCHESRKQQHKLRQHAGAGIGGGSSSSSRTPLNTDLDTPILPPTGYSQTDEYQVAIEEHHSTIRSQTNTGREWKNINREIPPTFSYRDLKVLLDEIMNGEHGAFKINIGFGSMLYDTVNQVYRYFYISHNHYLFDTAFTISTNHDMTTFFNKILSLQLTDQYYLQRPSSGWVLAGLPNLEIRVMRLRGVPIGAGVQLPAHIKNSKSIIGLTRDKTHGHDFEDNLCLFRCLALHFGESIRSLEDTSNHFKSKLEEYAKQRFDDGVEVSILSTVETCFKVAINVYSLQEDKTAKSIRLSNLDYKQDDVMHLNLYENHFSYIKKISLNHTLKNSLVQIVIES